jgi:hypothetical protein
MFELQGCLKKTVAAIRPGGAVQGDDGWVQSNVRAINAKDDDQACGVFLPFAP